MESSPLLSDPAKAWAPYDPLADGPWDLARVAHLHRRGGFAAPWGVLQRDIASGPEASIRRVLDGEATSADGRPSAEWDALIDAMTRQFAATNSLSRGQGLWLYRMIFTPYPLRERMTLFWHDHFATSQAKVNNMGLMQGQNDLIRRHALGDFRGLLGAMARDPAMLAWLDCTANRKAHPNENYAREVMELFTLGRGHYSESDIREAARAFTGAFVQNDRYKDVPSQHDDGEKTILGLTGRFRGEDVATILLGQPACAEFVCGKLFRLFLSDVDEPSADLLAPLAASLREANYDILAPIAMILRSKLFHTPAMRRRRVKSPVELTVGTIRALEILRPTVSADALAEATSAAGQALYAPPSVAGWEGGASWINTTTTLARSNFALAVLGKEGGLGGRFDPAKLVAEHGAADPAEFLADLLVQDGLDRDLRGRIRPDPAPLILTAPEYQLA